MNAQIKQINGNRPTWRTSQKTQAFSVINSLMPEITDDEINEMADWYAQLQWGELAISSDSLDHQTN